MSGSRQFTHQINWPVSYQKKSAALTAKQKAVLDFITSYTRDTGGASPSYREIAHHAGLRSIATVFKHVTTLEDKGYIARRFNGTRSIALTEGPCPYCKEGPAVTREIKHALYLTLVPVFEKRLKMEPRPATSLANDVATEVMKTARLLAVERGKDQSGE